VHAATQRFITRMPAAQPHARRCARNGRGQRFARANLRHNACRQPTSNLHLGFSARLTFELSGALQPAQLAVRCPLERGVGHQPAFGALTFQQRHLPLPIDRRTLPARLFADNPGFQRLGRSLLRLNNCRPPSARPLGFAVRRPEPHRPTVARGPLHASSGDAPRAPANLCTNLCAGNYRRPSALVPHADPLPNNYLSTAGAQRST
jgi:hypothetical protein